MKKYLKSLGIALASAPFFIIGILTIIAGMLCKSAGYALLGDFERASDEVGQAKLL